MSASRRSATHLTLALLLLAVRTAAGFGASPVAAGADSEGRPYVIGAQDTLQITVFGHDEFNRELQVLPDGSIAYPTLGEAHVAGKTVAEVTQLVAESLRRELLRPQVTVTVAHSAPRKYFIIGPVGSAGAKELKPGGTVRDAMADAGGLAGGKPEFVRGKILRGKEVLPFDVRRVLAGDGAADLPLEPGDLVQIEELPTVRVFLMGEVQKPGQLDLEAGMGVAQAIASAGGFTPKAAQSRTFIMRSGGEIVPVDLRRLLVKGVPDVGPRLEKGDVIVVPESQNKFAVLGEVRQPGYQAMPDGERMTVSKAINLAGGLQGKPKLSQLYILRAGPEGKADRLAVNFKAVLKGDLSQDLEVRPDDLIVVPKSGRLDAGQGFLLLQGFQWALNLLRFGLF